MNKFKPYRYLEKDLTDLYREEVLRRRAYVILALYMGWYLTVSVAFGAPLEQINNREPIVIKSTQCFSPEHTVRWSRPLYAGTSLKTRSRNFI